MTSQQFRSNTELVESMRKLLTEDQTLRLALSILDDESPIYDPPANADATTSIINYGFEKGYEARGKRMLELAIRAPVNVDFESDYSQP